MIIKREILTLKITQNQIHFEDLPFGIALSLVHVYTGNCRNRNRFQHCFDSLDEIKWSWPYFNIYTRLEMQEIVRIYPW